MVKSYLGTFERIEIKVRRCFILTNVFEYIYEWQSKWLKMSPWTSAIAKLNVANNMDKSLFYQKLFHLLNLTEAEWEIVYRCAQKAGFDPRTGYSDKNRI